MQAGSRRLRRFDVLGFDPFENGFVVVRKAAVKQGFAQTFVGIFELHVLPDHRNPCFAGRMMHPVNQVEPRLHVRRPSLQLHKPQNLLVQAFFAELDRKSTRLNSSHQIISYAVFCLKKKKTCMILPSGPGMRMISVAPKTDLENSMARAASLQSSAGEIE